MQTSARPALSEPRLARLSLWLALAIGYFVAHGLARIAPKRAAEVIAHYARAVRLVLVARAVKRAALPKTARTHRPAPAHRLTCRRVLGANLRRRLRLGGTVERARTLTALLAAPERWIAAITRRLRRRFTRLRRLPAPRRNAGARIRRRALAMQSAIDSS